MNHSIPRMAALACCFFLCSVLLNSRVEAEASDPNLSFEYQEAADTIIQAALSNEGVWQKLSFLCDRIGHRLSGSPSLDRAIRWAADTMEREGAENVRLQSVKVPHWRRGEEWARITSPEERPLHILGLGRSVGTGSQSVEAEVVVVRDFQELEALGSSRVRQKIVLYNAPFTSYGETVQYRVHGASRAAQLGAVAALVRSVTPRSLQTPHTGAMRYSDDSPKIPTAAVTIEDATLIQRLSDSGSTVRAELFMEAENLPDADSANVIAELVGRERPEEIVLIGAHIDSWDVGQGAHDDGGGVAVSMETLALLRDLGLRPRRTIRAVLFTNEENGLSGGFEYREKLGEEIDSHVAAIEMDSGAERPIGFSLDLRDPHFSGSEREKIRLLISEIARLLEPIRADQIPWGSGGADISPLIQDGVIGLGLRTTGRRYFDYHHTRADTVDKIRPEDLRRNLAAMAVMAYVLADLPTLDR